MQPVVGFNPTAIPFREVWGKAAWKRSCGNLTIGFASCVGYCLENDSTASQYWTDVILTRSASLLIPDKARCSRTISTRLHMVRICWLTFRGITILRSRSNSGERSQQSRGAQTRCDGGNKVGGTGRQGGARFACTPALGAPCPFVSSFRSEEDDECPLSKIEYRSHGIKRKKRE